jgi:hypothetical protein
LLLLLGAAAIFVGNIQSANPGFWFASVQNIKDFFFSFNIEKKKTFVCFNKNIKMVEFT